MLLHCNEAAGEGLEDQGQLSEMVIEDVDAANALAGNVPPNKLKVEEPLAGAHDLSDDSKYMQRPEAGLIMAK